MKIVIDENASYELVEELRKLGHEVISIAESSGGGMSDEDVYALMMQNQSFLVTRDHHFTNPVRFPVEQTSGIIYIRHGNLRAEDEVVMVKNFLQKHDLRIFKGKLVTLYKDSVRIR